MRGWTILEGEKRGPFSRSDVATSERVGWLVGDERGRKVEK